MLLGLWFSLALANAAETGPATNAVSWPGATETNSAAPSSVLRTVREIRHLPPALAAKRQPVAFHGVITYADPGWKHFFIQDATGGIYVRSWQDDLRAGQWVDLTGWTVPGNTVSMLTDATVRQLGPTNFPTPQPVNVPEMRWATNESQWVELEGVIRAVSSVPVRLTLKLSTSQGEVDAVIPSTKVFKDLRPLLNLRVRLQGVASVMHNDRREVVGPQLRVPLLTCVTVVEKAPTNAFAIEPRPIGEVSDHSPAELGLHRVRVHGVVSLVLPGGDFFLQDGTGAIRVRTEQINEHAAGKALDLVGFPVTDGLATRLEGAIFRYDPPAPALVPRAGSVGDLLASSRPRYELTELEGQLLNEAGGSTLPLLLVQSGAVVFQARFAEGDSRTPASHWLAGSRLRLTGVGDLQLETTNQARSFVLLLRTPADVQLLSPPPRWTLEQTAMLAGVLAATLLAILGWTALLRRTVRQQTGQIRQRLEAEAGLEKQLMLVWETSAEGMCMTDAQGQIVRVNEAYGRMVGKPRPELEGQLLTVVQGAEQQAASLLSYRERFARREVPRLEELRVTLWNGRQVWFELSNSFFEHSPFPTLLLSQFRDITERKLADAERERLEALNQQLQKSESLGRMARAIAHNFNNHLQPVILGLEMAIEDQPKKGAPDAHLNDALLSARRAAEISNQMLIYLGQSQAQPEPLDLSEICRQGLSILSAAVPKTVVLESSLPAPGPVILANANQIQQVLTNLLTNAWDASGDRSGTIHLTVKEVSATSLPTKNRFPVDWHPHAAAYACLEVADTGCGIAAANIGKLFDPFYSTKFAGRGLGLSVVQGIVTKYGGNLTVESEPDRGSVFRIFLPITTTTVAPPPVLTVPLLQRVEPGTVLVVDDDSSVRKFVEVALRRAGVKVITAVDGVDALDLFAQHRGEIGCVLCDLTMPRMDGWQTLTALRQQAPGIPVILASGYDESKVMDGHHPELPHAYLRKPYEMKALIEALNLVRQK